MSAEVITLLICVVCLTLLLLFFAWKYFILRGELRHFRDQLNEIRTTDREQPLRVASFGVPSVELAAEINLLVKELRSAAQSSAEEERRIRTIMAGVSHDFRTPLTSADGYLQLVEEMLKDIPGREEIGEKDAPGAETLPSEVIMRREQLAEIRDYLRIVSERIKYLRSLSDEFFEVTYLEAAEELPLSDVRLDTLLSEVILSQASWIEEGQLRADFRIPDEKMIISADHHYLERILENLFSNARKYARSFLQVSVDTSSPEEILLTMKNDVESSLLPDASHLFEPFYRAGGRTGRGTGLGLYVVKELAEAMHFRITGKVEDEDFILILGMPRRKGGNAGPEPLS